MALSRALGLDPVPDRARFVTELTRIIYDNPVATTDARLRMLTEYLQSARVDGQTETVPLPLSVKTWNEAAFERPVGIDGLFSAVITDRRAALLAYGLSALDDETLRFLAEHPALLSRLYERDSAVFASFAGSLRVRGSAVIVPGGEATTHLWEAVVSEPVSQPDRFIRQLFSRERGRAAYVYDAASRFDPATRAFALGLWMADPRQRLDRLRSLLRALEEFPGWTMPERSFRRPPNDPVLMMMRVPVDASGLPTGPSDRALWSQVFDQPTVEAGPVDAAWLAEAILGAELQARADRLDQLAFGLRVFSASDERAQPDRDNVIAALRAFPRYRMLLLSLERMGIRAPATYAAAVRHAARLSALNATDGFTAMSQFQGSLAMLVRLVATRVLDARAAGTLVVTLSGVPINDNGRYAGGVARWVQRELAPALGLADDSIDAGLIASLAGESARHPTPPTRVRLEEGAYHLDLSAPDARRMRLWLARLGAEPVSRALDIEAVAERLSSSGPVDVQAAITTVKALLGTRSWQPRDINNAARVAQSLHDLADDVLGDALLAMAYALNMEAQEGTFTGGNLSRRHDFGLSESLEELRVRGPWTQPRQQIQARVPWHVTGSLLGLDLGLSELALRRISSETLPGAPVLADGDRDVFTRTVALMNAFDLHDADRDAIAGAIGRGRQRLSALIPNSDGLEELADEIRLDGTRRRAVRWTLVHDPQNLLSFFSLTEFFHLGRPATGNYNAWGVAADAYDGCICTRLMPPGRLELIAGRWPTETVATEVADLNLRVAIALANLKLPAALAKAVLAAATQDFVDRVRPLYPYDWLTLVRTAQSLPDSRIDDYVAALTANGPLVPDSSEDGVAK